MVSNAIRLLEERHMATKIDVLVWSNKMDLLALANAKGEVTLHRLNWQKVWSLPPPTEDLVVKGMAWRPDGKVIAVAYSNNEVHLVDVENKDILHKTSYGEEPALEITCVCWQEEKSNVTGTCYSSAFLDCSATYLPKLPPISRSFGSMSEDSNEKFEDTKKVIDQTCLNFLFVGLSNGLLCISAFGLFPSGTIHLPDEIKRNGGEIISVEIMAHLKSLFVLVSVREVLKLITYETIVLSVYCREIHALAYKHGLLMSLIDYLSMTMSAIMEAYENMLILEIESKLREYAEGLPEGQVSADFLEFLMFGVTSDSLEVFIMQDLTDKGIKKLRHSIELSHSNIQKLILKHLQAVGQNIAYHLSELRGRARLAERLQNLGIDESVVAAGFTEIGSFLIKASELQLVIDDSLSKYKAFFKWLSAVIRVTDERMPDLSHPDISQQETAFIAEYLYSLERSGNGEKRKLCFLDRVGQYIADSNLTNPIPAGSNPWEKLLEQNPCLGNDPAVIVRRENLSLYQQYVLLKQLIREIFDTPQGPISSTFKVTSIKDLAPIRSGHRITHLHVFEENKFLIALIPSFRSSKFNFIQVPSEGAPKMTTVYFNSEDPDVGLRTVDIQFYLNETLSVLLAQPGEDRSAVFVQLPLRSIHEASVESNLVDGSLLLEPGALKPIDNWIACRMAVSGTRKVGVLLSENRNKVRMFETEVEEDEEEEEMETTRESENNSLHQSM